MGPELENKRKIQLRKYRYFLKSDFNFSFKIELAFLSSVRRCQTECEPVSVGSFSVPSPFTHTFTFSLSLSLALSISLSRSLSRSTCDFLLSSVWCSLSLSFAHPSALLFNYLQFYPSSCLSFLSPSVPPHIELSPLPLHPPPRCSLFQSLHQSDPFILVPWYDFFPYFSACSLTHGDCVETNDCMSSIPRGPHDLYENL